MDLYSQIQRQLEQMLSAVIDSPGQNASVILKGPVGVGKSLVSHCSALTSVARLCSLP